MPRVGAAHARQHAAKFYTCDANLSLTVADFLYHALLQGSPCVVIATPSHTAAIQSSLADRRINVERARRDGDMILVDAEDTLGTFMVNGQPDAELFQLQVGGILEQILRRRRGRPVRVYGEMVDVLCRQGSASAAVQLEMLGNTLALNYSLVLLCGYSMSNFFHQPEQFDAVCRQHTHVLDPATNSVAFGQASAPSA